MARDTSGDELKGKLKDVEGRVERHLGEWTGDEDAQTRGAIRQAEGKIQKGVGRIKNALKPKKKAA